eukprot:620456-Rhodomonas_salina.1
MSIARKRHATVGAVAGTSLAGFPVAVSGTAAAVVAGGTIGATAVAAGAAVTGGATPVVGPGRGAPTDTVTAVPTATATVVVTTAVPTSTASSSTPFCDDASGMSDSQRARRGKRWALRRTRSLASGRDNSRFGQSVGCAQSSRRRCRRNPLRRCRRCWNTNSEAWELWSV